MKWPSDLSSKIQKFHQNEDGMEALQIVMIIAVAAILLIGFNSYGTKIYNWMAGKIDTFTGFSIRSAPGVR